MTTDNAPDFEKRIGLKITIVLVTCLAIIFGYSFWTLIQFAMSQPHVT